jgi:hypothetical protein
MYVAAVVQRQHVTTSSALDPIAAALAEVEGQMWREEYHGTPEVEG